MAGVAVTVVVEIVTQTSPGGVYSSLLDTMRIVYLYPRIVFTSYTVLFPFLCHHLVINIGCL